MFRRSPALPAKNPFLSTLHSPRPRIAAISSRCHEQGLHEPNSRTSNISEQSSWKAIAIFLFTTMRLRSRLIPGLHGNCAYKDGFKAPLPLSVPKNIAIYNDIRPFWKRTAFVVRLAAIYTNRLSSYRLSAPLNLHHEVQRQQVSWSRARRCAPPGCEALV